MQKTITPLICPLCGSNKYDMQGDKYYYCSACDTRYAVETVYEQNELQKTLDEERAKSLSNAIGNLYTAVKKENRSSVDIKTYVAQVRAIDGKNFFANFYLACEDEEDLNEFLKGNIPKEYACYIFDYLLRSIQKEKNLARILVLVEELLEGEEAVSYRSKFQELANKLNSGFFSTTLLRDVFIAYSGKDEQKALEIVEFLEQEGYTCFVSFRNLRHGIGAKENYEKEIKTAIRHCKCFVFLSSENSRKMEDCDAVTMEIPYVFDNKLPMLMVEYILTDYTEKSPGTAVKNYLRKVFAGLEWCRTKEDLSERIFNALQKHDTVHVHVYVESVVESTCKEGGYTEKKCACGHSIKENFTLPIPHKYSDWQTTLSATCRKEGEKKRICTGCGDIQSESIPKKEHNFGEWETEKKATCKEEGTRKRVCSVCKEEKRETLPALGHVFAEWKTTQPATCQTDGEERQICERCKAFKRRVLQAKGHSYSDWTPYIVATCETAGEERKTCEQCNNYQSRTIPALGHQYGDWKVTKKATCETDGEESKTCANCGDEQVRIISALGHSYGTWKVIQPASCETNGEERQICERCKSFKRRVLQATGHQFTPWQISKPATCEQEGEIRRTCVVDGVTEKKTTPALGHQYGDWKVTKKATCETDGEESKTCANCGDEQVRMISALGHSYGTWKEIQPASCETNGEERQICERCKSFKRRVLQATGHQFTLWRISNPATCTQEGVRRRICSNCGKEEKEPISALGHSYGNWKPHKSATCEQAGEERKTCANCGDYQTRTIPALGHTFGEWKQEGYKQVRTCTKCGKQESKAVAPYTRSGKTVTFGQYPQSEKASNVTVTQQNGKYIGSDGAEYVKQGNKYFKVEPIQWRILEEKNGYATILSEKILSSRRYDSDSNNYANSEIRQWLNGEFLREAFTSEQKNIIQAVTVDNSARSTNPDRNANECNNGKNSNSCENTTDKVWLLSEQEVTKASYGFNTDPKNHDTVRSKTTSEYARCQGAYTSKSSDYKGKGYWWLRSPDYYDGDYARNVSNDGDADNGDYVDNLYGGVAPALLIRL